MTQKIILFNGPPRSGKDTAARFLFGHPDMQKYFCVFERMSMPIKKMFAAMMAVPIDKWGNVDGYEARKEEPVTVLGESYRQWQIDCSERFMKPLYGEPVFARLFVSRVHRQHKAGVILVPDCGFDIEYSTLCEAFGKENILVVKIYRPGVDWSKDSRNYLKVGSNFVVAQYDVAYHNVAHVMNSTTVHEFELKVLKLVKEWLK